MEFRCILNELRALAGLRLGPQDAQVCQCDTMRVLDSRSHMRSVALVFCCLAAAPAFSQTVDEDYRVYNDHPRLLLSAQRLKLLKRERDRDSMRWRQFSLVVRSAAEVPEPGFSLSLYAAVTGDEAPARLAIEWALGPGTDLGQLALVYDWCQPALGPARSKALAAKIRRLAEAGLAEKGSTDSIARRRDRVFAWIAIAGENEHPEEAPLRETVREWWRGQVAPKLSDGSLTPAPEELYPLLEILHAIRDNLKIELREDAPEYFRELPKFEILGNYPAPLQSPENEYRIPVYAGAAQPDVDHAALARAAGLAMVAYDNNALENQFLQGWLIQDRFMLQGTVGAPYEFLWANPYQPGLSYFQLPLLYHDPHSGALFVRSNWEDDAVWFGLYHGEAQVFEGGRITVLNKAGGVKDPKPIAVGEASVLLGRSPLRFFNEGGPALVIGLKPLHKYLVETDDEELREIETDRVGTLVLPYAADRAASVRIEESNSTPRTEKRGE
jgi:hypothetical protein